MDSTLREHFLKIISLSPYKSPDQGHLGDPPVIKFPEILYGPLFNPKYHAVYGTIYRHAFSYGICYSPRNVLLQEAGIAERTFRRYLSHMIKFKLIFSYVCKKGKGTECYLVPCLFKEKLLQQLLVREFESSAQVIEKFFNDRYFSKG